MPHCVAVSETAISRVLDKDARDATQYGLVSNAEWCRHEAARLKDAGRRAAVKPVNGRCVVLVVVR
jgi:hypothetical protein